MDISNDLSIHDNCDPVYVVMLEKDIPSVDIVTFAKSQLDSISYRVLKFNVAFVTSVRLMDAAVMAVLYRLFPLLEYNTIFELTVDTVSFLNGTVTGVWEVCSGYIVPVTVPSMVLEMTLLYLCSIWPSFASTKYTHALNGS